MAQVVKRTDTFMWTLNNFSTYTVKKQSVSSKNFRVGFRSWTLQVYPVGYYTNEFLSLILVHNSNPEDKAILEFKLSILNAKNEEVNVRSGKDMILNLVLIQYPCFIERKYLINKTTDLLVDDTLTILCNLTILEKEGQKIKFMENQQQLKLFSYFEQILENGKFSDVTLVTSGKKFELHKNVLAARSPVFAAMFEHNMKEKNSSIIEIKDFEHEVLQEMLLFIYTGRVNNIYKVVRELFMVADKYQIQDLKEMCEEVLCQNITSDSAIDTLIIADLHNANTLKWYTIDFILSNAAKIVVTDGFKFLKAQHSDLLKEVFNVLAENFNNEDYLRYDINVDSDSNDDTE